MAAHSRIRIFGSLLHRLRYPSSILFARRSSYTAPLATVICAVLIILSGCGDDPIAVDTDGTIARPVAEAEEGYRVIMRGLVGDTLTGRAQFGHVLDQNSGRLNWIIELVTADDFAGGIFIASPVDAMPEAGRYGVAADALSDPGADQLALIYRHGLFRVFRARSGSVTFNHVSDTLVSGTFDVILTGEVADRGREAVRGEAEASGSFSARRGQPGYVIGL